ncbi:hypothetical protein [Prescottella agglutinans]|uniref:hypothetical protein n=1 Tax=Prescottella agglutinans TaxID=1644129 RepID=UPI000FDDC5EE|nr:hypothetical protein [Prescottella agglutinans]
MSIPSPKRHTAAAVLAIIAAATGCSTTSIEEPTSARPAPFPYPPAERTTSIAVELDEHLRSAAQFAVELERDEIFALRDPAVVASMYTRMTRENVYADWPTEPVPPTPETGAAIYTATAVEPTGPGTVDVTVCEYYSPGIYTPRDDGTLERFPADPEIRYAAYVYELAWTTAPDANGTITTDPRWLRTGHGLPLNLPQYTAERDQACAPYAPDPFLTDPPAPTAER